MRARDLFLARSSLDELIWPNLLFVRYIFVSLSEYQFQQVPEKVSGLLQEYASSFRSTKVTEDLFHTLRAAEKANPTGHLSRESRWQGSLASCHLPDSDRPPVQVTAAAKQAAFGLGRKMPRELFDAEAEQCSLPKDMVAELINPAAKYAIVVDADCYVRG